MNLRWLTLVLAGLIVALQYPLWLGKGSWLKAWKSIKNSPSNNRKIPG